MIATPTVPLASAYGWKLVQTSHVARRWEKHDSFPTDVFNSQLGYCRMQPIVTHRLVYALPSTQGNQSPVCGFQGGHITCRKDHPLQTSIWQQVTIKTQRLVDVNKFMLWLQLITLTNRCSRSDNGLTCLLMLLCCVQDQSFALHVRQTVLFIVLFWVNQPDKHSSIDTYMVTCWIRLSEELKNQLVCIQEEI